MFFVFFPIDVFLLNRNHRVIEIKHNFTPWTFWTSKKTGWFVIEAPKGTVHAEVGDKIEF